jgi:drug/metabolite transporter (DMT)-like permease
MKKKKGKNSKLNSYILLHGLLIVYSFSSVLSKLAANEEFLSFKFCLCYSGIIVLLGIYAIFWQQIIKKLPLTSAYANRAITIIWGILWGMIFFKENLTLGMIIGSLLIISGIVLYALSDSEGDIK